jgi:hypothetical protein
VLGDAHGLDVVSSEDSVDSIECGTDVRQEGDRFRLVAVRLGALNRLPRARQPASSILLLHTRRENFTTQSLILLINARAASPWIKHWGSPTRAW